jgi:hypothetical protein
MALLLIQIDSHFDRESHAEGHNEAKRRDFGLPAPLRPGCDPILHFGLVQHGE